MPTYARDALEVTAVWSLLVTRYQRRSRGHKARGQGQPFREQTLSRPSTKDTAANVLQKKGLQKSFLGDLKLIGVPRIFDWGGLNHIK